MRILLVEDEAPLAELVSASLTAAGFVIDAVSRREDADAATLTTRYDVLILDLGLPDGDGLDLLAALRDRHDGVPVLILTARDAVEDRVTGLNAGADDYLVKPFAITELIARIKALLRRPGGALGTVLEAGNIVLDTVTRDARVAGASLRLARRELAILEHLMRNLGRVVAKEHLEERMYGMDEELESNAIPVHVHRLRKRLTDGGATVEIHTVRGIGYLLSGGDA